MLCAHVTYQKTTDIAFVNVISFTFNLNLYVWLASFEECWVGIAVRVCSTKVLHGHGGEITTPVATMKYNTG